MLGVDFVEMKIPVHSCKFKLWFWIKFPLNVVLHCRSRSKFSQIKNACLYRDFVVWSNRNVVYHSQMHFFNFGASPDELSPSIFGLDGEICHLKSLRTTTPAAHYPNIPVLLMPVRSDSARSKDLFVNLQVGITLPAPPDDSSVHFWIQFVQIPLTQFDVKNSRSW